MPNRAATSGRHGLEVQDRPRLRRSRCRRRAPRSSMGLSLRARGLVKLSQHEMLDLAQGRSRQIVDKNDIARYLETGKLRQHMRLQVLRFYYAPCAPNDVSHRHLVPFGIKPADHAAFNHIGML